MIQPFKEILYQIELTLLNLKIPETPTKIQKIIGEEILEFHMPNLYLKIGLNSYAKDLIKALKMLLYTIIAIVIISMFFSLKNLDFSLIFTIIIVFFLYIPFALPSTYSFDNINNNHLSKIINTLKQNKIKNLEQIEHFEAYLEKSKSRVKERINAIKWIVSAFWILITFLFSQYVTITSNHIDKADLFNFSKLNLDVFMSFLFPISVSIIFIACYIRGMAFIFNSIELALIEFKHQIKHQSRECLIQSRLASMT